MDDELGNTKSKILESMPGITDMISADHAVIANQFEPIDLFLEQPDGSKVRISFLASGEIVAVPPTLALACPVSNDEEPSKDSELATNVIPEESQQISAVQTPDGQIYYFETNPPSKTEKDGLGEAPIFYRLLPKDMYAAADSEPDDVKWVEDGLPKEDAKDNVYTNARERLKPFVTVRKTRRRAESKITQIGADLHLEDKIAARAALLPAPARSRRGTNRGQPATAQRSDAGDECVYRCDMCDAAFPRASQFFGHSKAHSKERALSCSQCSDKVFAAHAQLLQHERACHVSVRAHTCPACSASFDRPSQLANHRRSFHLKERSNKCGVCEKTFFKRSDLRSHLNIHLGLDSHVCPTCGRRFSHVSNLNRHLRTHTGVRPFLCATCGRRFTQASGLTLHAQTHAFPSDTRKVTCTLEGCTSTFTSLAARRAHLRSNHADMQADRQDSRPKRRFHCRVCGLDFPFIAVLKQHEAVHEKQDSFRCSWCQQELPSVERLKNHSCRSAGQRNENGESERVVLEAQMERLLAGSAEHEECSGSQDIVIYITHEGQEQVVHLKPSALHTDLQSEVSIASESGVQIVLQSDVQIASESGVQIVSESGVSIASESDVQIVSESDVQIALQSDVQIASESDVQIVSESGVSIASESDVQIVSESDVQIALQSDVQIASESDVQIVSESGVSIASESDVQIVLESDVQIALQSDVQIVSESGVPIASETDLQIALQSDVQIALHSVMKSDVPIASESGVPIASESGVPIASKNGVPIASINGVPIASQSCDKVKREPQEVEETNCQSHSTGEAWTGVAANPKQADQDDSPSADALGSAPAGNAAAAKGSAAPKGGKNKSPKGDKRYHCPESGCLKTFLKKGNYKQHLGTHYADARCHLCPICGTSFAWRSTLGQHLLHHTPAAQRQRHPCPVCHKTYLLPAQVQNHMRRDHDLERTHACPSCDKSFFKKHDLTVHLRTHTKETPYMCPTCGRCFRHLSHATRHARLHANRRTHTCTGCARSFAQAGTLRRHLARQACQP